jgi:hypothetical protein
MFIISIRGVEHLVMSLPTTPQTRRPPWCQPAGGQLRIDQEDGSGPAAGLKELCRAVLTYCAVEPAAYAVAAAVYAVPALWSGPRQAPGVADPAHPPRTRPTAQVARAGEALSYLCPARRKRSDLKGLGRSRTGFGRAPFFTPLSPGDLVRRTGRLVWGQTPSAAQMTKRARILVDRLYPDTNQGTSLR